MNKTMRVMYFGTYDRNYSRNRIMLAGLRATGVEVTECFIPLWHGTADKVAAASRGVRWWSLFWRAWQTYVALLRTYWPLRNEYDVMLLGYAGHFDVFPARVLSWLSGRPLVLDVFMSLYLIAYERQLPAQHWLRWIEYVACHLPDLLILDTAEYVAWFKETYGLAPARFRLVPTGADNRLFHPLAIRPPDGKFRAIYYGSFIPNHGVEYIVEAARRLANQNQVHFELIGTGPDHAKALALARGLPNITFVDWLEQTTLIEHVAQADVCLGAFGLTPQSLMTVQNKIYEGLALARPVITGDSPTVRAVFMHGQHLYLCERAHPEALAQAIETLCHDPALCTTLAQNGHAYYRQHFTVEHLGEQCKAHLLELLG